MVRQIIPEFDVAVIGGGPGGSAIASYLARAGVNCVVFEREFFPREHVGESLVPSSTRIFDDLGFLPKMEAAGFPHKYGAVWTVAHSNLTASHDFGGLYAEDEANVRFSEREQPGVRQEYTYHVDRGKFDQLLLDHAAELGADVCYGTTVQQVDLDHQGGPRIRLQAGRSSYDVRSRVVVDASGRRTFLGNRLNLKVKDPIFDQYAIHAWFEDFDRGASSKADFIFIHFLPVTNTWIWQIPISDTITSIGLVTQKSNFTGTRKHREQFFWDSVATRPELLEKLKAAKQVRPFKAEGDYSYAMKQIAGDQYVLIGDAARFVDPIFSSGISVALNSAKLASQNILAALETGDLSRKAFRTYEETLRRGIRNWYEFICLYYRLNIVFTMFVNRPDYRYDLLKLLQGDVYDEEFPPVLTKMRQIVHEVEENPDHPWHTLLGDLSAEALREAFR